MTADSQPVLEVDRVAAHLASPRGMVHAVDGVSFTLEAGRSLAIVGESGSGKSMLLRAILNLLPRYAAITGKVRVLGRDVHQMGRREWRSMLGNEIAIVLQDPSRSLNPVLRVETQVTEGLRHHRRVSRTEARQRALELMVSVGIPEPERRLRQYPFQLSGGMRQRVAIAAALACDPKILLADEITSSLDATVGARILDVVADIRQRRGMSVVSVTHDITVGARRSEDLLVMYGGRVMEYGPSDRVVGNPLHPYTAALLACVPRLSDDPDTSLVPIPGEPFDPVTKVPGCRFAPRCTGATGDCTSIDPPAVDQNGRIFACHHPLDHVEVETQPITVRRQRP